MKDSEMATEAQDICSDPYTAFANTILSWDGTISSAETLRGEIRNLTPIKGRPSSELLIKIQKIINLYKTKNNTVKKLIGKMLKDACDDIEFAKMFSPFYGDPYIGNWSHDVKFSISDEDSKYMLEYLGKYPFATQKVREFIYFFFTKVPRSTWKTAAESLAHLVIRDEESLTQIRCLWSELVPSSGALTVRNGQLAISSRSKNQLQQHDLRHFVYFASFMAYIDPSKTFSENLSVDAILALNFNDILDDSDRSIIIDCYNHLLKLKPVVKSRIIDYINDKTKRREELSDLALAKFCKNTHLDQETSNEIKLFLLNKPMITDKDANCPFSKYFEPYLSWLKCLDEFKPIDINMDNADHLAYAVCSEPDLFELSILKERLISSIRLIFDPALRSVSSNEEKSSDLAYLLRAKSHSQLRNIDWQSLLSISTNKEYLLKPEKTYEDSILPELMKTLIPSDNFSPNILRDVVLSRDDIAGLIASGKDIFLIQAAIQTELLLRDAERSRDSIKHLWFLSAFLTDEGTKYFDKLRNITRGRGIYQEYPVHHIILFLEWLYKHRFAVPKCIDLEPLNNLPKRVESFDLSESINGRPDNELISWSNSLVDAINIVFMLTKDIESKDLNNFILSANNTLEIIIPSKISGFPFSDTLIQHKGDGDTFSHLRNGRFFINDVEQFADNLVTQLKELSTDEYLTESPHKKTQILSTCEKGILELTDMFRSLRLPQLFIYIHFFKVLREKVLCEIEKRSSSIEVCNRVDDLIKNGHEDEVISFINHNDNKRIISNSKSDAYRIFDFLIGQLQIVEANMLRDYVRSMDVKYSLPHPIRKLSTLFLAGLFGISQVLDYGAFWDRYIGDPEKWTIALLVAIVSISLPFLLLFAEYYPRIEPLSQKKRVTHALSRIYEVSKRVLPLYAITTLAISVVVSLILFTLRTSADYYFMRDGVSVSQSLLQLGLWTGLSMTLGSIINIVLERKGFTE